MVFIYVSTTNLLRVKFLKRKEPDSELRLRELGERIKALTRRVEELEATAFQLVDEEEVVLVAVPRKDTSASELWSHPWNKNPVQT